MHVVMHSVRNDHDIFPRLDARMKHSINEELDRFEGQNIYLIRSQALNKTFNFLVSVVVPNEMRIYRLFEMVVKPLKVISASI